MAFTLSRTSCEIGSRDTRRSENQARMNAPRRRCDHVANLFEEPPVPQAPLIRVKDYEFDYGER